MIKEIVRASQHIPVAKQCLYSGRKPLDDDRTLEAQGCFSKNATIELRMRMASLVEAPEQAPKRRRRQ